MSGAKYREIGRRGPIHVHCVSQTAYGSTYAIYQGKQPYDGRIGTQYLREKMWTDEAEAQAFLDRVAKVRGWRKV